MKTKYILASLAVATLATACQNEDFTENAAPAPFLGRTTVDLTIGRGADTRLTPDGDYVNFDTNDELGAVIVDGGTLWTIANTIVGNNKWEWSEAAQRFVTKGTTAIGSWLFYSQYDPAMTTQREALKYSFKQIQEGSVDATESAKKGVDFFLSPVIQLDGYEGEQLDFNVPTSSIHARALLKFKFDAAEGVEEVQKVVVKATKTGVAAGKEFILEGQINNEKVAVADVRKAELLSNGKTAQEVIDDASVRLRNSGDYATEAAAYEDITEAGTGSGATSNLLALDCISHTDDASMKVTDNEFKSIMLIPAGRYESLTFYVYTNKGIYRKEIRNATPEADPAVTNAEFVLRRNHLINLADITKKAADVNGALTIKADNKIENSAVVSETGGTIVLKTVDLVEAVKGITTDGVVNIKVLGNDDLHKTQITKEVMAAIRTKKAEYGNLQIVFDKEMEIVGETENEPLELQDITFGEGAKLISGYAKVTDDINITTGKSIEVSTGAALTFTKSAASGYAYAGLKNNGTVNIEATDATSVVTIGTIENNGTLNIKTKLTNAGDVTNALGATITNESEWSIAGTGNFENNGGIVNEKAGVISLEEASENNGTITNSGEVNVKANFDNNATITNNKEAVIVVNGGSTSALNNKVEGKIYNSGDLYCHEGDNTINNVGRIEVKDNNATTYITTNSEADESTTATNDDAQVMGEIVLMNAKDDVSVTTTNRKGYISWNVPTTVTSIATESGYKFNKVYLTVDTKIEASAPVQYIEATGIMLTLEKDIQELAFSESATIYATRRQIAQLSVKENCRVKVPTDNEVGVYDVEKAGISKTEAKIINKGTILVGGNFWSKLTLPNEGTFASGDGNTTAFHWGKSTAWTD